MAMRLTMNTSATAALATSLPALWTTTASHEFATSLTHPMCHVIASTADDNHPIQVFHITDPSQCELAASPGHHQGKWRAGVASWALSWQRGGDISTLPHFHPPLAPFRPSNVTQNDACPHAASLG